LKTELEKINHFPDALVPNAKSLDEVFESWQKAGLTPTEVSEEDLISEIKIEAGKHNGELKWSVEKADGIRALGIMAVAMRSMFQEYLQDGGRHKLSIESPNTKVAIQLNNNKVQIAYNHKQITTVKGLLIASLWKLIEETEKDDIHPLDKFTGELNFKINE
tara:strand:- start:215 stop:700 length:486 start_codon:yes stop_codon:yes gene_type:complete